VSVWAEDGTVSDASVRLSADPASLSPTFSFGCANSGTASCALGSVDSDSASLQFQAAVSIPASASSVTSAQLTATVKATDLLRDPAASVPVEVTAASSPATTPSATQNSSPAASPLAVGDLPYLNGTGATLSPGSNASRLFTLSPGGNASRLFPSLSPASSQGSQGSAQQKTDARQVADTSALPLETPVADAQLAGLGALAVGLILAVTRLSVRRRAAAPKSPAK
jgi:hypothetical protein